MVSLYILFIDALGWEGYTHVGFFERKKSAIEGRNLCSRLCQVYFQRSDQSRHVGLKGACNIICMLNSFAPVEPRSSRCAGQERGPGVDPGVTSERFFCSNKNSSPFWFRSSSLGLTSDAVQLWKCDCSRYCAFYQ